MRTEFWRAAYAAWSGEVFPERFRMRMQMATLKKTVTLRIAICLGLMLPVAAVAVSGVTTWAQAPAAAPAAGPKVGTVKGVSGTTVTLLTDPPASQTITLSVPDTAKVQKLAVGSTDIKTATPSQFSDIAVGDRVLTSVKAGDTPDSFVARQVILMKSGDIAQKNAADQADWRQNGTAGLVASVDAGAGTITVSVGAKKVVVTTSAKTDFRRFTGDSVKYQDAKPGTLSQIQPGDQIQAKGVKSADGSTVQAADVVSGSFKNLSGVTDQRRCGWREDRVEGPGDQEGLYRGCDGECRHPQDAVAAGDCVRGPQQCRRRGGRRAAVVQQAGMRAGALREVRAEAALVVRVECDGRLEAIWRR